MDAAGRCAAAHCAAPNSVRPLPARSRPAGAPAPPSARLDRQRRARRGRVQPGLLGDRRRDALPRCGAVTPPASCPRSERARRPLTLALPLAHNEKGTQ